MSRDQKFTTRHSHGIGVYVAGALVIFLLAMKISDMTTDDNTQDSAYQAAVSARIRPVGQIYLPGEEHEAPAPTVEMPAEPEPVATRMTGPQVYNTACLACHGAGIGGAPILGDVALWADRIAQGTAVLKQHALSGFAGSTGYMPPKGGRVDLSDAEIEAAVDYMIAAAQ